MSAAISRDAETDDVADPISVAAALGIPAVRVEILRHLRRQPATIAQIALSVGFSRYGLRLHLDLLEQLGGIAHTTERVRGIYRPTRLYHLNRERTEAVAWNLFDAFVDDDPETAA